MSLYLHFSNPCTLFSLIFLLVLKSTMRLFLSLVKRKELAVLKFFTIFLHAFCSELAAMVFHFHLTNSFSREIGCNNRTLSSKREVFFFFSVTLFQLIRLARSVSGNYRASTHPQVSSNEK